jgi:hypothetical protein
MKDKLMLRLWRHMLKVPPFLWEKPISKEKEIRSREQGGNDGGS